MRKNTRNIISFLVSDHYRKQITLNEHFNILGTVGVLLILVFSMVGCSVDDQDIIRYGEKGNVKKLITYIDKNYMNSERIQQVQLAITYLFERRLNPGWDYLRPKLEEEFSSGLVRYTLLAKMKKGYTPDSETQENMTVLKQAISGLVAIGVPDEGMKEALNLVSMALRYDIEPKDSVEIMQNQLQAYIDSTSKLDRLRDTENQLKAKIAERQQIIDETMEWAKTNGLKVIRGYIIAQKDAQVYEIRVKREHAFLLATDSRFERQGYFDDMLVTELMEMPVELHQEYGGFTQTWKVYREVPSHEIDRRQEESLERARIAMDAQEQMRSFQGDLEPLTRGIKELRDRRFPHKLKVARMLNGPLDFSSSNLQ